MIDRYWEEGDDTHVGVVEFIRETPKAIFVKKDGQDVCLPKSGLRPGTATMTKKGDKGQLVIASWIARDRGWV